MAGARQFLKILKFWARWLFCIFLLVRLHILICNLRNKNFYFKISGKSFANVVSSEHLGHSLWVSLVQRSRCIVELLAAAVHRLFWVAYHMHQNLVWFCRKQGLNRKDWIERAKVTCFNLQRLPRVILYPVFTLCIYISHELSVSWFHFHLIQDNDCLGT